MKLSPSELEALAGMQRVSHWIGRISRIVVLMKEYRPMATKEPFTKSEVLARIEREIGFNVVELLP